MPTAAERAAGLLTTRGGGPGPAPAQVAAAVAVHGRCASIARMYSATTVATQCTDVNNLFTPVIRRPHLLTGALYGVPMSCL